MYWLVILVVVIVGTKAVGHYHPQYSSFHYNPLVTVDEDTAIAAKIAVSSNLCIFIDCFRS